MNSSTNVAKEVKKKKNPSSSVYVLSSGDQNCKTMSLNHKTTPLTGLLVNQIQYLSLF